VTDERPVPAKPRHYKELLIWQRSMALARTVYRLTARFPAEEKFGMTNQLRRAAVSVPSNIAEGQARKGTKEFAMFLSRASGSLAEVETQLLLSADIGYAESSAATSPGRDRRDPADDRRDPAKTIGSSGEWSVISGWKGCGAVRRIVLGSSGRLPSPARPRERGAFWRKSSLEATKTAGETRRITWRKLSLAANETDRPRHGED